MFQLRVEHRAAVVVFELLPEYVGAVLRAGWTEAAGTYLLEDRVGVEPLGEYGSSRDYPI